MKITLKPLSDVLGDPIGRQYRWSPRRGIAFAVSSGLSPERQYAAFCAANNAKDFNRYGFKHWLEGHDRGPRGNVSPRWHHGYDRADKVAYAMFHVFEQYERMPPGVSRNHPLHIWGFKLSPYAETNPSFMLCILVDAREQSTDYGHLDRLKREVLPHVEAACTDFAAAVSFGSKPYWSPPRN